MKKPYIIPKVFTVVLGPCKMMAETQPRMTVDPNAAPTPGNELDVKESVNLWDEEW